jgi:hypothetical protein
VVVLPSTVTATAQISAASSGCPGDAVCVAVGLLIALGPLAGLVALAQWAPIRAVATTRPRSLRLLSRVTVERIVRPSWRWELRDTPGPIAEEHTLRHCILVLREYRSLPYASLDAAVLSAVGVLVAVSGHGLDVQCTAAAVLTVVLYAAQLAVCAWCCPFMTLFSMGYNCFALFFTMVSAVLQLCMFLVAGSNDTAQVLLRLSLAASISDLVVIGASMVRTLQDVADAAVALRTMLQGPPAPPLAQLKERVSEEGDTAGVLPAIEDVCLDFDWGR